MLGARYIDDASKALLASGRIALLFAGKPLDPASPPTRVWLHASLVYRKPYDVVGLMMQQADPDPLDPGNEFPARAVIHSNPFEICDCWEFFEGFRETHRK